MTEAPRHPRPLLQLPPDEIVVVAGFGRCGSSLAMQMLSRGGCPVVGRFPAYEGFDGFMPVEAPQRWIELASGRAIKALDPMRWPPPPGPVYRVIWMDRNAKQQARSALKLVATEFPMAAGDVKAEKSMARSYVKDRPLAMAALRRVGADILVVRFEKLLADPAGEARRIADHVGLGLDITGMARMVIPRTPQCRPDLSVEGVLIEVAEIAAAAAQRQQQR